MRQEKKKEKKGRGWEERRDGKGNKNETAGIGDPVPSPFGEAEAIERWRRLSEHDPKPPLSPPFCKRRL